jgi:hypothetical protein
MTVVPSPPAAAMTDASRRRAISSRELSFTKRLMTPPAEWVPMSGRDRSSAEADAGSSADRPTGLAARLRRFLRSVDPGKLGFLAVLAIPGYLVESLAFLQAFMLFALFFLWGLLQPLVDAILGRFVDDEDAEDDPRDWLHMGGWRYWAAAYGSLPISLLNPLVLTQDLLQFVGIANPLARYRGSLPDDPAERTRRYRLPVEGTWTVVNGSTEEEYSHSWFPLNQRYAYDLVVTDDDGRTHPEDASPAVEHHYCYDEPIVAPADGVVVDAYDTDPELYRGGGLSHPLKRTIFGNYVTIQHAPDEYSTSAHLLPGSVAVEPGESVERGQEIGRCGHSGNSSEPHLHFQLQDGPVLETAMGLPIAFAGAEAESPARGDDGVLGDLDDSTLEDDSIVDEDDASREEGALADGDGSVVAADESTVAEDGSAAAADGSTVAADGGDRTAITVGQRVRQAEPVRDRADGPWSAPGRGILQGLERLTFGVAVGFVLIGVLGGWLGAPADWILGALAGGTVLGPLLWLWYRRTRVSRPGGPALSAGLALATAAWWLGFPGPLTIARGIALAVVTYLLLAEGDRMRLRNAAAA